MLFIAADDVAEWGKKIIEVYMTWYTFFMTSNVVIMGWFASKDSKEFDPKPLTAVSYLFIVLNLFGVVSTLMVSRSVGQHAPEVFQPLIFWAGYANMGGLLGNVFIWAYLIRIRQKHFKKIISSPDAG
jgi:prolipoprotein diacylglyceryltransferase